MNDNGLEMYSTQNERKYVVAKTFTRTLKKKIYKHIITVLKNKFIDRLDENKTC